MEASTNHGTLPGAPVLAGVAVRRNMARRTLSKAVSLPRNLLHLRRHFHLSRLLGDLGLLNQQDFYTGIRYRYLRKYYLGSSFSIPERLAVAVNHHQSMARHFLPDFLRKSRSSGFGLWRHTHEDSRYDIALRYPYNYNHDGDLCLTLDLDGENICIVTFSIAPGALAGVADSQVLLVSGIQGIAGKIAQIRQATEACNNVSPAHMLLFAAQTLANEMGIKTMVGMGQGRAQSALPTDGQRTAFDYDAFWMPMVGVEAPRRFYHVGLPFTDKPIESIPAKHRSRARKRRELRNVIRQDIEAQAQVILLKECLIANT